jgi:hypothetical protein
MCIFKLQSSLPPSYLCHYQGLKKMTELAEIQQDWGTPNLQTIEFQNLNSFFKKVRKIHKKNFWFRKRATLV